MVSVRVSSKLEASWDFFSRRIEWRSKKFFLIFRILENTISPGKNKQHQQHKQANKKATRLCLKFIEKYLKIRETKMPWPATKEDK